MTIPSYNISPLLKVVFLLFVLLANKKQKISLRAVLSNLKIFSLKLF